jgi:hypothetical protein
MLSLDEALDMAPLAYWSHEYNRIVTAFDGVNICSIDLIDLATTVAVSAIDRQFPDLSIESRYKIIAESHGGQQSPIISCGTECHRNDDNESDGCRVAYDTNWEI